MAGVEISINGPLSAGRALVTPRRFCLFDARSGGTHSRFAYSTSEVSRWLPLEELTGGASIKGILPDGLVTVVDVKWHGSNVVELTYKDPRDRPDNGLVCRDRESTIEDPGLYSTGEVRRDPNFRSSSARESARLKFAKGKNSDARNQARPRFVACASCLLNRSRNEPSSHRRVSRLLAGFW